MTFVPIIKEVTTGFFASTQRATLIHLVSDNKPLCNSLMVNLEYLRCVNSVDYNLLECQKCKQIHSKL